MSSPDMMCGRRAAAAIASLEVLVVHWGELKSPEEGVRLSGPVLASVCPLCGSLSLKETLGTGPHRPEPSWTTESLLMPFVRLPSEPRAGAGPLSTADLIPGPLGKGDRCGHRVHPQVTVLLQLLTSCGPEQAGVRLASFGLRQAMCPHGQIVTSQQSRLVSQLTLCTLWQSVKVLESCVKTEYFRVTFAPQVQARGALSSPWDIQSPGFVPLSQRCGSSACLRTQASLGPQPQPPPEEVSGGSAPAVPSRAGCRAAFVGTSVLTPGALTTPWLLKPLQDPLFLLYCGVVWCWGTSG